MRTLLFWLGLSLACRSSMDASFADPVRTATQYWGMCDASAMVPLTDDLFVVGDDEDNFLRIYSRRTGGLPVATYDVSRFLGFKKSSGETDIEGAARLGDRIYWISSHGRNAKGKEQPRRQRFFATQVRMQGNQVLLEPVGIPYAGLLRDLAEAPQLQRFQLAHAARGAPKNPGSLNIEGLAATSEGGLLIGFRNPIPQGKALVVPLMNPAEVIAGRPARLGEPRQLDLGGLGIRSLERWQDGYLILAGPSDSAGSSRLYIWPGDARPPRRLEPVDFGDLNPEAIAAWPDEDGNQWLVLSDDGARICDGVECKRLKDPRRKRFRALLIPGQVTWPGTAATPP